MRGNCENYFARIFFSLDHMFVDFISGILENSADDFEDGDEIYEAIGEILHEVAANKTEDEIKWVSNFPFFILLAFRLGKLWGKLIV